MRIVIFLGLSAGCLKTDPLYCQMNGSDTVHCPAQTSDAAVPGADSTSTMCLGADVPNWTVCFTTPTAPYPIPSLLDTESSSACQSDLWSSATQPDACFIVATSFTMAGDTSVTGSRPLVLVATGAIAISHKLDVASHLTTIGAASPNPLCSGGMAGGMSAVYAGGGGGSYATLGGAGGAANGMPALAGQATNALTPHVLGAGCAGTLGGGATGQGKIGHGGGAVFLIAGSPISIAGSIDASGGPGGPNTDAGANHINGGSGGGSGGMIVILAPSVTGSGGVYANGGGGGCGADGSNMLGDGGGESMGATSPGAGCPGSGAQVKGGSGYATMMSGAAINATPGDSGGIGKTGGGGGGGGGFVSFNHDFPATIAVSPPRSDLPK